MFLSEIWDKFTVFVFWNYWNLPSEAMEILKFQKVTKVNLSQICDSWLITPYKPFKSIGGLKF